jgi:hypothetical protein
MSTPNVKEIVREKYGQAALRLPCALRQALAIPAAATTIPLWKGPVIR